METTDQPAAQAGVQWVASWGDKVQVGDLIKVTKLGGAVRVTALRKFNHNHGTTRPVLVSEDDDGHWYYGAVVQDTTGREFHLFIQPHEACFIGLDVPGPTYTGSTEGAAPDGELG